MSFRSIIPVFLALSAGCVTSAPQYRYYTLDMRPSGTVTEGARLDSVRIDVTESLHKNEILIRTSPTQIEYYALDRWASGLDQQISEKLLTEFSTGRTEPPSIWIEALLLAFEQVDGPEPTVHVKLDVHAGWYADGRRTTDLRKMYDVTQPAANSKPEAAVRALSQVVERIASEIAREPALQPQRFGGNTE